MQYLVAVYSGHDGDNRIFEVTSTNPAGAAKEALIEHCPKKYRDKNYLDWVKGMDDNFDAIALAAAQSELVLARPFLLNTKSKIHY